MSQLRELKAANLRVNLAKELEKGLKNERFDEIRVIELCQQVDISKVTFFKYFSSKEELLRYYFRIWCLRLCKKLEENPSKGLAGIYFLFENIVKGLEEIPYFFYAYYSYQVNDDRIRSPFPLKSKEREILLGKGNVNFEIRSIFQLLEGFVLEAIFQKELKVNDSVVFSDMVYKYMVGLIVLSGIDNKKINYVEEKNKLDILLSKYK